MNFLIFSFGSLLGFLLFYTLFTLKKGGFNAIGLQILKEAEKEAENYSEKLKLKCEKEEFIAKLEIDKKWQSFLQKMQKEEKHIKQRELALEKRASTLETRTLEIEKKQKEQEIKQQQLNAFKEDLEARESILEKELETLSGLSQQEAREELLQKIDHSLSVEKAKRTARNFKAIEEESDLFAKKILITAIHRTCLPCTSELTITTVPLPNESIKGRIIGREGRNIRYLEELCGVNLVIDDTPSAILISGFDPIRKEVAKNALQHLIQDGRIHPTRIEEVVKNCQENIGKEIITLGNEAILETGIGSLHPHLTELLGQLYFRTSIGQNLLRHSIEVSLLMGLIAAELSLDVALAKRIGLLHDIGKALPPTKEKSHAIAGYEFAMKCGESKEVAHGIGAHHDEMDPLTIEGSLCSTADAISGSRPGARSVDLEKTFRRMHDLEELSLSFEGVIQAFALQAGKELRVFVSPQKVDDARAAYIASALAQKIEEKIPHSGKIKITVFRPTRIISYAI